MGQKRESKQRLGVAGKNAKAWQSRRPAKRQDSRQMATMVKKSWQNKADGQQQTGM